MERTGGFWTPPLPVVVPPRPKPPEPVSVPPRVVGPVTGACVPAPRSLVSEGRSFDVSVVLRPPATGSRRSTDERSGTLRSVTPWRKNDSIPRSG